MFGNLLKRNINYKFSEPKNMACMICSHILDKKRAILYVSHDADDGMWQFLCGEENHKSDDIRVIALFEAVTLDGSINQLYEMPLGFSAIRDTKHSQWKAFRMA